MTPLKLKFLFEDPQISELARTLVEKDACVFHLSWKFQIYYRFLRPFMPIRIRQMLQRSRRVETSERWYEPTEFMHLTSKYLHDSEHGEVTIHPWPDGYESAFVLTHDVETSEGMRHIARIADFEESQGFRSSWNLVPHKYDIDRGLVRDLKSRGFEIGIHGFNHDGQLYSSRRVFNRRADRINRAIKEFGAVGFRSPMVHRNLNWLQALEIDYDSSCFDVDPFQAAPGGVGSIWPFIAGRFVELPYTMPQDHTLFVANSERDERIWIEKLAYIVRRQGMALMLTHPDYLVSPRGSKIYFNFLKYAKSQPALWHALPSEVAKWWREREQLLDIALAGTNNMAASTLSSGPPRKAELKLMNDGFRFIET